MKRTQGLVISTKNPKTAIVEVARFKVHPIYEKRIKRTTRYPVHDSIGVKNGDQVEFVDSKPYSKSKRWIITKVITSTVQPVKELKKPEKKGATKKAR